MDGARTRDHRLHKPALYQLSYRRHKKPMKTAITAARPGLTEGVGYVVFREITDLSVEMLEEPAGAHPVDRGRKGTPAVIDLG